MKEGMVWTPIENGWSKGIQGNRFSLRTEVRMQDKQMGRTVISKRQRWETWIRGGSVDGNHTRAMGTPVVRSTIGSQWMDLRYCKYYRRVGIH